MNDEQQITIELLYTKYYRELFTYSFSLFDFKQQHVQDAEDCVQDTFEKAIKHQDELYKSKDFLKYLKWMCRNITVSRRRDIHRHARILGYPESIDEHYDIKDAKDIVMDWIIKQENKVAKEALLESLSDKEKEIYHYYYEQNLSIKETAKALDCSDTSVRGGVQRIRAKAMKLQIFFIALIITCIFGCLCT